MTAAMKPARASDGASPRGSNTRLARKKPVSANPSASSCDDGASSLSPSPLPSSRRCTSICAHKQHQGRKFRLKLRSQHKRRWTNIRGNHSLPSIGRLLSTMTDGHNAMTPFPMANRTDRRLSIRRAPAFGKDSKRTTSFTGTAAKRRRHGINTTMTCRAAPAPLTRNQERKS